MNKIVKSIIIVLALLCSFSAYTQEEVQESEIIRYPDGSMSIITFGVDVKGNNIKRVTNIKVTEYADGTKLVTKTVKEFDLESPEEKLVKTYVETSIVRTERRNYNQSINDNARLPSASPDGT